MARNTFTPNPNPNEHKRTMLDAPESIKFRRRALVLAEGVRGNSWSKGTLRGWEQDAAIVACKETGATRTLSPEYWEWKSA